MNDPAYIVLSWPDIAIASVFVIVNAILSIAMQLNIHRRLLIAAARMVVQLALMALVLTWIFSIVSLFWTAVCALVMILFAGREISARQERPLSGWWSYGLGTGSMMVGSVLVTVFGLVASLHSHPWYEPKYAIPLLGMILGNTMSGISLGLQSITTGLVSQRAGVEAQLMLGATRYEAMLPAIRRALRSALMPIINSMSVLGIVSLPGMMTGQILGGVPPGDAAKYQILIMLLIAGGTGIGAVSAVVGAAYRLSDNRDRLRLERLSPIKKS